MSNLERGKCGTKITCIALIFILSCSLFSVNLSFGQYFGGQVIVSVVSGSSTKTTDAYSPNPVSINVGDSVTWRNDDSTPHTVTSGTNGEPDGNFDSSPNFNPLMAPKQTFTHTFRQAGNFPYYCGLHPNMVGTVIVTASESVTTLSVQTDRFSYESGDTIRISGRLVTDSVTQPILIQVIDPEGDRDRIDQVEPDSEGFYSFSFDAGGMMNTDGTYTVIASYKTIEEEATFDFEAGEVSWRPINVDVEGTNYRIEYMITGRGNSLDRVTGDVETMSMLAEITAVSSGTLMLRFSEEFMDAEDEFVAFIDDEAYEGSLPAGPGATNILEVDFRAGAEEIGIVASGLPSNCCPTPQRLDLTVSTDSSSYIKGSNIKINAQITGNVISGQNVAISVSNPSGASVISRTVTTDTDGFATLSFRIADDFKTGTYRVVSTALVNGVSLDANTQFTVRTSSSGISIVSLQATDQQGNPVSSFSRGSLAFVKVVVSADASVTALVTINIFDSELTSLGVGSLKTTIGSGNSETVLSFFIPNDATSGQSDVYANVFSDWPASGGVPLNKESSIQVRIQ